MALSKLYELITWINGTAPALNEDNLNAMSQAIDDIDDRVIDLAGTIMEDVPQIIEDMAILEPAIENIDDNVARAEAAADSAEQYAEEIAPPIEVVKDYADIITVDDAINKAAKDVKVKVEAVQDLHGYTKPWVGGAGKNLLPIDSVTHPSGQTTENITIFEGTLSGTFTISCDASGATAQYPGAGLVEMVLDGEVINPYFSMTVTACTITGTITKITVYGSNAYSRYIGTIKFQLESGSTATAWTPYSNLCPITGHSEANVTRAGKNLLKNTLVSRKDNEVTFTHNSDDTVTANGGPASGNCIIEIGQFTGLSSVFLSGCPSGGNLNTTYNMQLRDVTTSTWGQWDLGEGVQIDGLDKSHTYSVYIIVRSGYTANNVVFKPMISIERGAYEPYKGKIYTIDLDGTRYLAELDVTSGVLTVIAQIYDLGDYNYNHNTGDNRNYFYTTAPISDIQGFPNTDVCAGISTGYVADSWNNVMAGNPTANGKFAISNDKYFGIRDDAANSMSTTDFKTYVTGIKILAMLATPTTIQLTAEEVQLLLGYNTLFADTGDLSLTYDASGILRVANAKLDIDTFKSVVAASSDFADFKTRVAAL